MSILLLLIFLLATICLIVFACIPTCRNKKFLLSLFLVMGASFVLFGPDILFNLIFFSIITSIICFIVFVIISKYRKKKYVLSSLILIGISFTALIVLSNYRVNEQLKEERIEKKQVIESNRKLLESKRKIQKQQKEKSLKKKDENVEK